MRIKIQQTIVDICSNQTLNLLTSCLFWLIQTQQMMRKGKVPENIIHQKVLLRIKASSSMDKTCMTKPFILI